MDTVLIVAAFIFGSVEREDAINQLMQELASERRQAIEDFLAGEKPIGILLAELKLTLISENDLLISTNSILDRILVFAMLTDRYASQKMLSTEE